MKNQSGYLALYNMEIIYDKRNENKLVFSGYCENGEILSQKQMQRMFKLSGTSPKQPIFDVDKNIKNELEKLFEQEEKRILEEISVQDSNYFEEETKKIDKWANDIKIGLELDLRGFDKSIDEINVKLRAKNLTLKQRLELQEKLCTLKPKRKELRMKIYEEQDKIDDERKKLIDEAKEKLILKTNDKQIFVIKWEIV